MDKSCFIASRNIYLVLDLFMRSGILYVLVLASLYLLNGYAPTSSLKMAPEKYDVPTNCKSIQKGTLVKTAFSAA